MAWSAKLLQETFNKGPGTRFPAYFLRYDVHSRSSSWCDDETPLEKQSRSMLWLPLLRKFTACTWEWWRGQSHPHIARNTLNSEAGDSWYLVFYHCDNAFSVFGLFVAVIIVPGRLEVWLFFSSLYLVCICYGFWLSRNGSPSRHIRTESDCPGGVETERGEHTLRAL